LKLEAPTSVEASSTERHKETYPRASIIHFHFPARGELPPVRLTWYDGGLKPPRPDELGATEELGEEGLMFIGDKGTILCGFNGNNPKLISMSPKTATEERPRTRSRTGGGQNVREWLDACKGGKTKPGANFEFCGVVTEALQLGNMAVRTGRRLTWDRANLKVTNLAAADQYIRPERRAGWEL